MILMIALLVAVGAHGHMGSHGTNEPSIQSSQPHENDAAKPGALHYGGKITDQSGALVQYNAYDGIERLTELLPGDDVKVITAQGNRKVAESKLQNVSLINF